jgi:hypothetical protein
MANHTRTQIAAAQVFNKAVLEVRRLLKGDELGALLMAMQVLATGAQRALAMSKPDFMMLAEECYDHIAAHYAGKAKE